jgi:predicted secreted protein
MPKYKGSDTTLQVSRDNGATWENVPGERVSAVAVSNEQVDTGEKTTQAANGQRELINCGVRSAELTASGIVKDGSTKTLFNFLCTASALGSIIPARKRTVLPSLGIEVSYQGNYLVQSFGRSGEYNGAELWTLSLSSASTPVAQTFPIPVDPPATPSGNLSFIVSTRKYLENYAGPCMRIRRSSDNTEQDFGFGADGWVDTAAALAFCGAGNGYVVSWYNQDTTEPTLTKFTNGTANQQPIFIRSGAGIRHGTT